MLKVFNIMLGTRVERFMTGKKGYKQMRHRKRLNLKLDLYDKNNLQIYQIYLSTVNGA